ncbi:hypothetical protein BW247_04195 [Acidihalobacter ferrooxydans]|uniref:GTPase n=2 Tax=Acidihalobacter ferrooxydans TaxID=1765967 RepID=A0A1P8UEX8_9GAMM|nr:hypothetical protein BW247_04195 [Acidihalobacter ferrooxydans]
MLWPSLNHKSTLGDGAVPTNPRALRHWVKELPLVNMGETSRRFYNSLLELNRLDMPPRQRIENMETMIEPALIILAHLQKQFVARSLPLPRKGRKILRLMLTLQKEIATGYEHAMRDIAKAQSTDTALTALATQRALHFMGEIFLRSVQLYEPEPAGLWHDIHLVYGFAEEHGVIDHPVPGCEDHTAPSTTPAQSYKRIALCALSMPNALRKNECIRLNDYYAPLVDLVTISQTPEPDSREGTYIANLELDRAPAYLMQSEIPAMQSIRCFNLDALLAHMRADMQHHADDSRHSRTLTADQLRRVYKNLTSTGKRRFARTASEGMIHVAIGFDPIHRAIEDDPALSSSIARLATPDLEVSTSSLYNLQTIHDTLRNDGAQQGYYDPNATQEDIWGLMSNESKWDARDIERGPAHDTVDEDSIPDSWSTWTLVSASPGGFGIRWTGEQAVRAQVGEIIALRELEEHHSVWRLGIIRWMHDVAESGLIVGVDLLASQCICASLRCESDPQGQSELIDTLILPGSDAARHPNSLIVPSGQLHTGQKVTVHAGERVSDVCLLEQMEHSHSFTQFLCGGSEVDADPPQKTEKVDVELDDSIWRDI